MQTALPRSWTAEFERAARVRREDIAHKEKAVRFETQERERRQERAEQSQDLEASALADIVLASADDITAFRIDLDSYDTGTVEALMDNREALDAVRERIDTMLGQAEVLPDGRRVFKTRDGLRVFDEHGQELTEAIIDPDTIDDKKPRWEFFQQDTETGERLEQERSELLSYQAKLDNARSRLDEGDITAKALDDMQAQLAADMPDAVRMKLGLEVVAAPAADQDKAALVAPLTPGMDAFMRQTGFAPSVTGP